MSYEPLFEKPAPDWSTAQTKQTIIPSEIHGRHEWRMQPRPMGTGTMYAGDPDAGAADTWRAVIILGVVGLIIYLLAKNVKKNPPRRRTRRRAGYRRAASRRVRDDQGRFI